MTVGELKAILSNLNDDEEITYAYDSWCMIMPIDQVVRIADETDSYYVLNYSSQWPLREYLKPRTTIIHQSEVTSE